jgi:hypothetical protein
VLTLEQEAATGLGVDFKLGTELGLDVDFERSGSLTPGVNFEREEE